MRPALTLPGAGALVSILFWNTATVVETAETVTITKLTAKDFRYAREMGYVIKLLGIAESANGEVGVRVHPALEKDLRAADV